MNYKAYRRKQSSYYLQHYPNFVGNDPGSTKIWGRNANHSSATISQKCVPMTTAMAGEWYTDLWWFRGQQVWHMGTKESYKDCKCYNLHTNFLNHKVAHLCDKFCCGWLLCLCFSNMYVSIFHGKLITLCYHPQRPTNAICNMPVLVTAHD
jgi:hypothetical protein